MPESLESLYAQAQQAIAAKEYDRARELLQQVLAEDVNYRDASKLLAQLIARSRRRWYNDVRLWGAVGAGVLIVLGVFIADKLTAVLPTPAPATPTVSLAQLATSTPTRVVPTGTPTTAPTTVPSPTRTPTVAPTSSPTPVPFAWKRLAMGQEFPRDAVAAIVVDPKDPEVMYAGMENAGIYKSIDGGNSWQPAHSGLSRASVHTLVIDQKDPRVLYAGIRLGGLYKSTDGGQNWKALDGNFDLRVKDVASIVVIDPQDNRHLYYTPAFSLYESMDAGASWTKISKPLCPEAIASLVVHPTESKTLLATDGGGKCKNGVYKSRDGGRTWDFTGLLGVQGSFPVLAIDSQKGNLLYTSMDNTLYRSSDGGENWNQVRQTGCSALAIARDNSAVAYCAWGSEVFQTGDSGQTWQRLANVGGAWIRTLSVSPHSKTTLLIGGQGVYVSTDGGVAWSPRTSGLSATRFQLKPDPMDSSILYAEDDSCRIFRSSDRGRTWQVASPGDFDGCDLELDASGQIQYLTNRGGETRKFSLARSADRGKSWESLPLPSEAEAVVIAHPRKSGVVFAFYQAWQSDAYISLDRGTTWQKTGGVKEFGGARIASGYDQGQVVYAMGGGFMKPVYSNDGGQTWGYCSVNDYTQWYVAESNSRMVIDPRDSNHLIVATRGNGVMASQDGCKTFQPSNKGLGNLFVNTVAIDPKNPARVYAGTDGGAYVSFDGGKSWSAINDGLLGALVVYSIVVDPKDSNNVYAATPYGIFKLEGK